MNGRSGHIGDFRRQWLRDILRYTDTAVSYDTIGMFIVQIPEFILSIYEAKRWVVRTGEYAIITNAGRRFFESYE